jgi:hypothetical protein
MWKSIVKPGRPQMTIWGLHIACGMLKATNTLSVCVIFITFSPLQWLHKCASVLRYTTEPVIFYKINLDLSAESSVAFHCSGYCLRVQRSVIFNTRFLLEWMSYTCIILAFDAPLLLICDSLKKKKNKSRLYREYSSTSNGYFSRYASLTLREEGRRRVFETRLLRRIFGLRETR